MLLTRLKNHYHKMKKRLIITILCFLFATVVLIAGNTTTYKADSLYKAGKYNDAAKEYIYIIDKYGYSSEIFYNLGNAQKCNGNLGEAVIAYKKALIINPSDAKAANNLNYINSVVDNSNQAAALGTTFEPTPESISVIHTISNFLDSIGPNRWAVIALICFILCLCGVIVYIFVNQVSLKKVGFFGGLVMLVFSIIMISLSTISKHNIENGTVCVVTVPQVTLKLLPQDKSKDVATPLTDGTILTILEKQDNSTESGWMKVYLNSEYTGWIKNSEIKTIEL